MPAGSLFVCGHNKTVYRSDNSGVSWTSKNVTNMSDTGANSNLWAIDTWDGDLVMVGGLKPRVFRSTNGGDNWTTLVVSTGYPDSAKCVRVQFLSATAVVACWQDTGNNRSKFMISNNAGNSWLTLKEVTGLVHTFHFLGTSNVGFYSIGYLGNPPGTPNQIFKTTDGGNNWSALTVPNLQRAIVTAPNDESGYVAAIDVNGRTVESFDAGATFDAIGGTYIAGTAQQFNCIFANPQPYPGFVGDANKYVYAGGIASQGLWVHRRPVDGWTKNTNVSLVGSEQILKIWFRNGSQGYFVTSAGRLYRTSNGGLGSWTGQLVVSQQLNDVAGVEEVTCDLNITSVTTTPSIDGADGSVTINVTGTGSKEYSLDGIFWQTSNTFAVPAGTYTARVRNVVNSSCSDSESVTVLAVDPLEAELSKTDVSAVGQSDGSVTVTVTAGSGEYEALFVFDNTTLGLGSGTNPQSATKNGLPAGVYEVVITDLISGQSLLLDIIVGEPAPVEPTLGSFLFVPMMNSLRFVQKVTANQCETFQTFDNTLLCDEEHPYFAKTFYGQKVAQCDSFPVQFQSDFQNNVVRLYNKFTDELAAAFTPTKVYEGLGQISDVGVYIANNGAGQSRVYPNTGEFPIPLAAGDVFTIKNNADGFNGNYAIVSVENDLLTATQYLVISLNYTAGTPTSTADAEFASNVLDFDIWEAPFAFGSIPVGTYYATITGDDGGDVVTWESEPIEVDVNHPDTNLIEYRCADNCFDMVWQTGITCRVRVESWFHNRLPKGKRTVSRNCDGTLVKVSAQKWRRGRLETKMLPPYLHEKLSVVFDCDVIRINGVAVQTDEDYSDPKYITRYQLANSEIVLEFVGWFTSHNSDDTGDVDAETGFIIANEGFLKR